MPSLTTFPPGLVVARRAELRATGITDDRIRTAMRTGRWQEPIRGVVVPHAGALTQQERWLVALAFTGDEAALSHHSALRVWGAKADELAAAARVAGVRGEFRAPPEGGMAEVSVPHGRHLVSRGFVVVHQSRRPLEAVPVGPVRVVNPARAAVDVALTARRRADVDHVVSDVLQRGLVTVEQLVDELRRAGRAATPWLRSAIADAGRGMRSVGESELRRVVLAAGLPEPEWNAPIETSAGTFYVDALWRRKRVAAEADGVGYHFSAKDWGEDLRRQNALHGERLVLLRFSVRRLRAERRQCGVEIARLVA